MFGVFMYIEVGRFVFFSFIDGGFFLGLGKDRIGDRREGFRVYFYYSILKYIRKCWE